MKEILEYIKQHYQPLSVIVYGSYADGSCRPDSDFDALVISRNHGEFHDMSFVNGIPLDVFVYPASCLEGETDCESFLQLYDGKVLLDTDEIGASLKKRIVSYVDHLPRKEDAEIREQLAWCRKMLLRAKRGDAEGMFRWHWLLTDSLEFFCDAVNRPYWGPKKTLRWMESAYPEGFAYYKNALSELHEDCLEQWIFYLEQLTGNRKN